ncbi:MAG: trehalose-phosphatase [Pseudomonadota bacterium]
MESNRELEIPPPLECIMQGGPVSLFLDFDGTLVELAPTPDTIAPKSDLANSLGTLAARLDGRCALISGRALSDIAKHIGPLRLAGAGSHGADVRGADGTPIGQAPEGLPETLADALIGFAQEQGIDYEAKPHGGALHYRSAPAKGEVATAFALDLAAKHGWHAQPGKCVVELVRGEADKGTAVFAFMREAPFVGSRPLFIGDDLTDEAGFKACASLGGAGILVGERMQTYAQYQLPDVASVHAWLSL